MIFSTKATKNRKRSFFLGFYFFFVLNNLSWLSISRFHLWTLWCMAMDSWMEFLPRRGFMYDLKSIDSLFDYLVSVLISSDRIVCQNVKRLHFWTKTGHHLKPFHDILTIMIVSTRQLVWFEWHLIRKRSTCSSNRCECEFLAEKLASHEKVEDPRKMWKEKKSQASALHLWWFSRPLLVCLLNENSIQIQSELMMGCGARRQSRTILFLIFHTESNQCWHCAM